jgi:SWI/SNF-related matrix-associated actin-dependent regulator of chromatin subfamily A-like protein 1
MELKQALQKAQTDSRINKSDLALINQLQKSINITGLQYDFAVRTLKRYGIVVEEKIQGRRATLRENRVYPFGELRPDELKRLNNIPGAIHYRGETHLPCNHFTIKTLREMQYQLSQNIIDWERENETVAPEQGEFDERLYPYQREDVLKIEKMKGRVLLASQMGTGKTCIVSTYIKRHPELSPKLIVCPASLKLVWARELKQWGVTEKITIVNGKKSSIPKEGIVILNYDLAFNYYCDIEEIGFKLLCCDESHYLCHTDSKRSRALKYVSKNIEQIMLLSGTPLTARPANLWGQLSMISPEMFNSQTKFMERYCNIKRDSSGKGASNTDELNRILSESFMIRRLKKDILKDLPPKIYTAIPFEMSDEDRKTYDYAKTDLINYLKENYGLEKARKAAWAEAIVKMSHLRQLAVAGKMEQSIQWIKDTLENGNKIIVFAVHKAVISRLMEEFESIAVKIDGSVSQKQRELNVKQFQEDENTRLFVGNIQSSGVGITLTAADTVVFMETSWTPGEVAQAIDRAHRIGTEAECINIYYLVADRTIDQDIARTLDAKARTLADVLDGGDLDEDVLINTLIEQYRKM